MCETPTVGLFTQKITTAQTGSAPIKAAAGASSIGSFVNYSVGGLEERALSIPTISRARDLLASMIGCLELKHYTEQWTGEEYEEIYLPLERWMERPDPRVTRNFFLANVFSDLFFYGRAFAVVTERYQGSGFPSAMQWIPAHNVSTLDQVGPIWYGPSNQMAFNGQPLITNDVIQFLSPVAGLVYQGSRAINIAIHLDQAADRYATLETVPGYLQQKGGETMDGESLSELAAAWASARRQNAIGALNDYAEFVEYKNDPSETVMDTRKYQALELARIANIPPYLIGYDQSGMTYQNAQQARQDLYLFGARPFIDCIEQTLSMDNVLPRGRYVEFDLSDYLDQNEMADVLVEPPVSNTERAQS